MNKRQLFYIITIFTAVLVITLYFFTFTLFILPRTGNEIVVKDQDLGDEITVEKLTVKEPSLLVAELEGQYQYREPQDFLAGVYVPIPDTYSNFTISANTQVLEIYKRNQEITAYLGLYKDVNKNKVFDKGVDVPLRNLSGKPVSVKFTLYLNE